MRLMISLLFTLMASVTFAATAEIPVGVMRMSSNPDMHPNPMRARLVETSGRALTAACPIDEELVSATCEADMPRAFDRNDFFHERVTLTKTEIVVQNDMKMARCRTNNMRYDDYAKITIYLKCTGEKAALTASN